MRLSSFRVASVFCAAAFSSCNASRPPVAQLIAPLSGAFVSGGQPTFRWIVKRDVPLVLEICRSRSCDEVVASAMVTGMSEMKWSSSVLSAGTVFWRIRGAMPPNVDPSATWELLVGAGPAAQTHPGSSFIDFDGDGLSDVILRYTHNLTGLTILPGSPGLARPPYSVQLNLKEGEQASRAVAEDMDGDGLSEIIVGASCISNCIHGRVIVLGAEGPTPTPKILASVNGASKSFGAQVFAIGDINHDGYGDVAVTSSVGASDGTAGANLNLVLGGSNTVTLDDRPLAGIDGTTGILEVVSGDFDHDGITDLAVLYDKLNYPAERDSGQIAVFHGHADGTFIRGQIIQKPTGTDSFYAASSDAGGDVDGDGVTDLVIGEPCVGGGTCSGSVFAMLPISAMPRKITPMGNGRFSFGQAVANGVDLNGDGLTDVVIAEPAADQINVFWGGLLQSGPVWNGTSGTQAGYWTVGAGDVDGDGRLDLLLSEWAPGQDFTLADVVQLSFSGTALDLIARAPITDHF